MTATVIDISSRFAARPALSRKEINKGIMERENEQEPLNAYLLKMIYSQKPP